MVNTFYRAQAARAMAACEQSRQYARRRLAQIRDRREFIVECYPIDWPAARQAVDGLDAERRSVLGHYRSCIYELNMANRGLALKGGSERLP